MRLVVRLILAVIGFAVRQWRKGRTGAVRGEHRGTPYYERVHSRKGKTFATSIGMPLRSPTWIRMHGESRLDRFFKRIGVANELATGDAVFDARVYVTCDHPAVANLLARSAPLRAAIQRGVGPSLPSELQVTRAICNDAVPASPLVLAIGPGRWGLPWYRSIRAGGTTWTAPM